MDERLSAAPGAPPTDGRDPAAAGPAQRPKEAGVGGLAHLQSIVLGGPDRYTRREIAEISRLSPDEVRRLWRAMGFPDVGDAVAFTDADLAAVLRVAALIERGVLDFPEVVELARSLGQTTYRLAEWQVEALARAAEQPARHPDQQVERIDDRIRDLMPEFERLLAYAWRRQLAATLGRLLADLEPDQAPDAPPGWATVGFADLVSFTRLSRQLDDAQLAALVHTFETLSADIVHSCGGRLVKTLGDEVMFVADSGSEAAEIALRLHEVYREREDFPQIRGGLATGPVLNRMGDVFGTTVNMASRLTASARPGTTLVDGATAEALSAARSARYSVRVLTPRPVRGLGIVRPYTLSRAERRPKPEAAPNREPAPGGQAAGQAEAETSSG